MPRDCTPVSIYKLKTYLPRCCWWMDGNSSTLLQGMPKKCILKIEKGKSFKGCLFGQWRWHKCFFLLAGPTHRKEQNNGAGALQALDGPGEASWLWPAGPFSSHGPPTLLYTDSPANYMSAWRLQPTGHHQLQPHWHSWSSSCVYRVWRISPKKWKITNI